MSVIFILLWILCDYILHTMDFYDCISHTMDIHLFFIDGFIYFELI